MARRGAGVNLVYLFAQQARAHRCSFMSQSSEPCSDKKVFIGQVTKI